MGQGRASDLESLEMNGSQVPRILTHEIFWLLQFALCFIFPVLYSTLTPTHPSLTPHHRPPITILCHHLSHHSNRTPHRLRPRHSGINILLHRPATHPHRPNPKPTLIINRLSAPKDNQPSIRLLDAVEISSGLRAVEQAVGREEAVEGCYGLRFFDADVDAAEVGVVHAQEGEQVAAGIEEGDVIGDAAKDR